MKWNDPKVWVAFTLVSATLVGCLSEYSDGTTSGKQAGLARPESDPGIGGPGTGERGNGNDNGGAGTCADFDGDGTVGMSDLALLLASWGLPPQTPGVDLDGDGLVGLQDLALLLSGYGSSCGGNGNGNDNGVPNGNDNGVPNGNDNGVPNGNDNGVPNGNDNGVPNGNDNGVPNGNDNGVPNGNDNGVPNGNDNGVPNGNDNGVPNGNDNGTPNGNDNGANGNGNDNGTCPDGSVQFRAQLSGDANNEAEYRDLVGGCSRFRVRVRSLAAFTTYAVAINGVAVGTLTTDDRGRGELEYSPLPAGFPDVQAGDVVTVGPVSGAFADDCSSNANCNG